MPPRPPNELEPELFFGDPPNLDARFAVLQMSQVQRELSARNRHVLRTTGRWLDLFEYVKMLENDHLLAAQPVAGHRQFFDATVAMVRGLGTMLLGKLQNDDAEQLKALGVTYRDLVACVDELLDIERSLHSDMTPEMAAELERQLFSGGQSK